MASPEKSPVSVPLVGFSVPAYAGNDLWWKYDYDAQTDDLLRRYTNLSDTGGIGYSIVDRYSEIKCIYIQMLI